MWSNSRTEIEWKKSDGVHSTRDEEAPDSPSTEEKQDKLKKIALSVGGGLAVASWFTPIGLPLALLSGASSLAYNVFNSARVETKEIKKVPESREQHFRKN